MQSCPIKNQHPKSLYTYRDICIYIILPLYPKIKKTHMNSPFLVPWKITSPSCCWWNPPWNANKSIPILILVKKNTKHSTWNKNITTITMILLFVDQTWHIYIYTWKTPKNHHTISNFMSNISNISYNIIIFQKEAKHFIYTYHIYIHIHTHIPRIFPNIFPSSS